MECSASMSCMQHAFASIILHLFRHNRCDHNRNYSWFGCWMPCIQIILFWQHVSQCILFTYHSSFCPFNQRTILNWRLCHHRITEQQWFGAFHHFTILKFEHSIICIYQCQQLSRIFVPPHTLNLPGGQQGAENCRIQIFFQPNELLMSTVSVRRIFNVPFYDSFVCCVSSNIHFICLVCRPTDVPKSYLSTSVNCTFFN